MVILSYETFEAVHVSLVTEMPGSPAEMSASTLLNKKRWKPVTERFIIASINGSNSYQRNDTKTICWMQTYPWSTIPSQTAYSYTTAGGCDPWYWSRQAGHTGCTPVRWRGKHQRSLRPCWDSSIVRVSGSGHDRSASVASAVGGSTQQGLKKKESLNLFWLILKRLVYTY
jgi:hypothetical protein